MPVIRGSSCKCDGVTCGYCFTMQFIAVQSYIDYLKDKSKVRGDF